MNPEGLNVADLAEHRDRTGSAAGFRGATLLPGPKDVLEVECDILIPAALENQITLGNVGRMKAKMIAEAANGPTTPGADAQLNQRGILVIPDIYLNAGGVTVSYFEWTKNISHIRYGRMEKRLDETTRTSMIRATEGLVGRSFPARIREGLVRGIDEVDLVRSGLEETMVSAFQEILEIRNRYRRVRDLRTAAYICAIEKVGQAYLELGIFP